MTTNLRRGGECFPPLRTDPAERKGDAVIARIQVPYETAENVGAFLDLEIPDGNLVQCFIPQEPHALPDVGAATKYAVENLFDCKPLTQLVRRGDRVTIITENQFQAAPADRMFPPILDILQDKGAEVKIVVGNGKVSALSKEELEHKLGMAVVASGIPIECNNAGKSENYTYVGTTTRGVP